jgi:Excreted virulence factor EspC, type VII ESX diderm
MADLVVDGVGLSTLSSTLSSITDNLDATRSTIDAVRDDLGSGDLWDALDDFEDNWDDGRGQIDKNMKAMRELLEAAVKAYDDADQELADGLNKESEG